MKKTALIIAFLLLFSCGCAKTAKDPADGPAAAVLPAETDTTEKADSFGEDGTTDEEEVPEEASIPAEDDISETVDVPEETDVPGEEKLTGESNVQIWDASSGTEVPAESDELAEADTSAAEGSELKDAEIPELTGGTRFYGDYMCLFFSVPDGWKLLDRSEIAELFDYNEEYVRADPAQILWNYYPYYELWAEDGNGNMVQFIIENTPVFTMDGTGIETAEEYQDHNAETLPEAYQSIGIEVFGTERSVVKIAGHSYERFSFSSKMGEVTVTQTMLSRKSGACMCTIYLTCVDEALEEQLMSRIFGKD